MSSEEKLHEREQPNGAEAPLNAPDPGGDGVASSPWASGPDTGHAPGGDLSEYSGMDSEGRPRSTDGNDSSEQYGDDFQSEGRTGEGYTSGSPDPTTSLEQQGSPEGRMGESVLSPTKRKPAQGGMQSTAEIVKGAFSTTQFVGIRALPNALHNPNFRQQLAESLAAEREREAEARAAQAQREMMEARTRAGGGSQESMISPKKAGTFHPGPQKLFSSFAYIPSEYERERELRREEERKRKEGFLGSEFKVTSIPSPIKHLGAFGTVEYELDPYETKEQLAKLEIQEQKEKILAGPQKLASGASTAEVAQLKERLADMLPQVGARVKAKWPRSFHAALEDTNGCIIVCFVADAAKEEGDIHAYMQEFSRSDVFVEEFKLRKDGIRWGAFDEESGLNYYALVPPWVRLRVPDVVPKVTGSPRVIEPALISNRTPFIPQTPSGIPMTVHVNTYSRSFKY
eukprot:jgi/Mesvir1/28110/Mv04693-RA.1